VSDYDDKPLDAPLKTPDGKETITLEGFLDIHLKNPVHEAETLRLNACLA
jgi:hypothetical protein